MLDYTPYKPSSCSGCPLLPSPGPCFGHGDPNHAKLIYIAQNPGREEVSARPMEPLIGPSGRVFNRQLAEAGIRRSQLFITNQVKCLTPNNREPTEEEINHCRPLLQAELNRCRADTVILAGATAFAANIGSYSTLHPDYHPSVSIFERMGCVEQRDGRKWIATPHPAFIMRLSGTPLADEAVDHLRKGMAISGVDIPLPRVITHPTPDDIQRHKEAAWARGIFADDCETVWIGEELSDEDKYGDEAWLMDMVGMSAIEYEAIILERKQAAAWAEIWTNPSIIQAEHNGEYDRFYLERTSPQNNIRFDTMLAHHMLHNIEHKYLKPECVRRYTNLPYYNRDLEKIDRRLYCGMDNIATLLVAERQLREMKDDVYVDVRGLEGPPNSLHPGRLHDLYFGTAFPGEPGLGRILPILEEQRRMGLRIDLRKALVFARWLQARVDKAEEGIRKILGPYFNWRSYGPNGDVQRLFYKTWGLPGQYKVDKKTREKKLTCDDDAREKLKEWINASPERQLQYPDATKYFSLVDESAEASKLLEYLSRISASDLRVHAMQKAHGTATFRIASKPNTQNWPTWPLAESLPSMRSIVLADEEDDLLLAVDFDQVELWTYAAQFDIRYLLEIYESGKYIYGATYEDVLKRPFFKPGLPPTKNNKCDHVTDQEILRMKAIPLGFLYARSGESVAQEHGWEPEVGRQYRQDWFNKNPELGQAHQWITYEMTQRKQLRPPPGMKLHFPKPELQGLNCFGQTPAAILLWTSMILIDEQFKKQRLERSRVMLSVHDSMLFNVGKAKQEPERMRHVVETIVKPILTRPIAWLKGFRYKHSTKVGTMWDWEMEDYDKWQTKTMQASTSSLQTTP